MGSSGLVEKFDIIVVFLLHSQPHSSTYPSGMLKDSCERMVAVEFHCVILPEEVGYDSEVGEDEEPEEEPEKVEAINFLTFRWN
jgi:hypothetical protein